MKKMMSIFAILFCFTLIASPVLANGGPGHYIGNGHRDCGGQGGIIGDVDVTNHNNIHNNNNLRNTNTNNIRNTNTNTNRNNNTNLNNNRATATSDANAVAGAVSGSTSSASQGQGQDQNQSIDQTIEGDVFSQVFEAADIPRSFGIGTEINYPATPTYMGPDTINSNMVDLETYLKLKRVHTRAELEVLADDADVDIRPTVFVPMVDKKTRKRADRALPIYLGTPTVRGEVVGMIMTLADDNETTSLEVMGVVGNMALDYEGVDALYIPAYGGDKIVKAKGWGIGFNHTSSTMNSTQDLGTVSSGGTGWSTGESGFKTKPWIHGLLFATLRRPSWS